MTPQSISDYINDDMGTIRQLRGETFSGEPGKGWRYSDKTNWAIQDVYWTNVTNHYLIQGQSRRRQLRMSLGIKPMIGPINIKILEPETTEAEVNRTCLEILANNLKNQGLLKTLDNPSSAILSFLPQFQLQATA